MNEQIDPVTATVVGAVLGGIAGYLLFSTNGRALRRQLERSVEDAAHEVRALRGTMMRISNVATDGWNLLKEAIGEDGLPLSPPAHPHQTTPF